MDTDRLLRIAALIDDDDEWEEDAESFDDDDDYYDEGMVGDFWGSEGSGMLFTTGEKILLLKRSGSVEQPGTWGVPGGAVPVSASGKGKDVKQSAIDESEEEMGRLPSYRIVDKVVFSKGSFKYTTFIAETRDDHFRPLLNWENDTHEWVTEDELRNFRLHFGVEYILDNARDKVFFNRK